MEFCDCSLEDQIREVSEKKYQIPINIVKHFIRQVFSGLVQLHDLGICHRDLKPENILLKWPLGSDKLVLTEAVVKIADLGAAKVLDKS